MNLLDTNIIIYAGKSEYAYLRPLITDPKSVTSVIAKIESLGFHSIKPDEKRFLQGVFTFLYTLPISDTIVDGAIELRYQWNLKLGDAIIAATALAHNCTLYTHNSADFHRINNLKIIDPVKS